ncbi:phosphotransferase family protein [Longispora fulva]|uniref:Aminoglycoside phosphotransferase n=1 Tax=Longispora fulva TaxID=619741 RepID=A0A8J7GDA8_9ACTN|nr:hypothetical protein [Longispora fulva]MBG6136524.1 hypothetical protein [Longispora fulva]
MQRTDWTDLPGSVRDAITARTGPVTSGTTAAEGLNSQIAAFLTLESGDTIFVKGLRLDHRGVITQRREAAINPYVLQVSPRMLWQVDVDGWDLLGFEYVQGRHADYTPGSADLPGVIEVMNTLGGLPCPELPELKHAPQRWASYAADPDDLALFEGDTLLHTDFNPVNILIGTDDAAWIIDWAWPTRGAAWIDPACFVLRLLEAGHTPEQAEAIAAQIPAWKAAPDRALDAFAAASVRQWDEIAANDPADWKQCMVAVVRDWAQWRGIATS